MDSLIDLGYWGLFIGSFLASTLIPMSADVLLVGILAPVSYTHLDVYKRQV